MTGGPSPTGRSDGFRFLGETVRFHGWRIEVTEARFTAPDGTEFTRHIVRHPGAVAVVAVTDGGDVLLVRQYRGAVDRELLEIPAGTRDVDGEEPVETARRELLEEVGVHARHLRHLGTLYNSPGFCDEETQLFLATGLDPGTPDRDGIEERHMEVVTVPLSEVDGLVAGGELIDGQTILGLLMARHLLARG
ncbi:MAG TPA: NUDIX hydrolase [Acidimicrobiales bacterium]|nr:NUDIX hydrolase [Acidimicrobiales bacterium]